MTRTQKRLAFWIPLFYGLLYSAVYVVTNTVAFDLMRMVELFVETIGMLLLMLWLGFLLRSKRAAVAAGFWLLVSLFLCTVPIVFLHLDTYAYHPHVRSSHATAQMRYTLPLFLLKAVLAGVAGAWLGQRLRGNQPVYGADKER